MLDRFLQYPDSRVAELTGRACLLLPATVDEADKAEVLIDRALATADTNPFYLFAKKLSEYRHGRWDKSLSIMNGEAASVMGPAPA